MITLQEKITDSISWSGAFFGFLVGILTYIVLTMIGLAIGGELFTIDAIRGFAWGAVIWVAVCLAISAFLAGYFGTRAAPGIITRRAGYFIGIVTGTLLLLALTFFTINSLVSAGRAAFGVAAGAASALPDAQALGVQGSLQQALSGFNREDLERLIAQNSPELDQNQVSAASDAAENVIRSAASEIARGVGNISTLGQTVSSQADRVYQELTGPQFVQQLQQRGLSADQAQEVSSALSQRVSELRTQLQQVAAGLEQQVEAAADALANAAWIWLLSALILLAFSVLGGALGSDQRLIEEREEELRRPPSERPAMPH